MIAFLISNWKAIGIVLVVLAIVGYIGTLRIERDNARNEMASFKQKVAEAATIAAETALKKTVEDEQRKEKTDAENVRLTTANAALVKRLRDTRANGGFVSPAAPGAASPSTATYDRAELERALRTLDSEVQGFVDEGSKAVIDLNTAREWARGR